MLDSLLPTSARRTCAAATCAPSSRPTRVAERRLAELVERRGRDAVLAAFGEVLAYAERRAREALAALPDGDVPAARRSRATA